MTGPGQTIGVSVFIDHFVDDLGVSRSSVGVAYLIGTLVGASLLPMVGRYVDRRGVRIAQVIVGGLFAAALVNMSFVQGIVWLAIGFTGIRFLGQGSLSLVSTVTVQIRFRERRGTALGIFAMATAGLIALVPIGLNVVIDQVGWRDAWLVAAAAVAVIVIPIGWFGLKSLPIGRPHGSAPAADIGGQRSYTRHEAIRTRGFWVLASISASTAMMATALNFHQIDLLGDAGLSKSAAAALFFPQVIGSTLAGLTIGYLSDRIGVRFLPSIGMVLLFAAQLLASVARPGFVVVLYAIVLGAAAGSVRTAGATLQPTWFGIGHIGSIQGALTFVGVAGSALGPVVLTLAEEWFGSYPPAILALCCVPGAALLFSLRRTGFERS